MRKRSLVIAATMILVLGLATIAMAADPFVGTWKLNVAKSKFDPPSSALKSDVVKIVAQDNGLKLTFERVDTEGKAIHIESAPKFDGKEYPVTITGETSTNTTSTKRIDANTLEFVNKTDGKEITRVRDVISKDGKISTVTVKAKDAKGQEVTSVAIYDKQ